MEISIVIDIEIDGDLATFSFYFKNSNLCVLYFIGNPDIGTLEQYDKLRKGEDVTIYYSSKNGKSVISMTDKIVHFEVNRNNHDIIDDCSDMMITASYDDCKHVFEQCYEWKYNFL